jgi:hypothetical protein
MRVEITEAKISDVDLDTGRLYTLEQGDILTVPDALGARWCAYGWARDTAGVVPTGERIPGPRDVILDVQDHTLAGGSTNG